MLVADCIDKNTKEITCNDARKRMMMLQDLQVAFIPNDDFQHMLNFPENSLGNLLCGGVDSGRQEELPGRMCDTELLTVAEEIELFREMNFLKYRFCQLRDSFDLDQPDLQDLTMAEQLLQNADVVRNQIIRANMRLVVSIAQKFVSPQHSFDDNVSDGTWALMQCVEKFDFDRGFRFSTYAYRAIIRNILRNIQDQQKATAIHPVSTIVEDVVDYRQLNNSAADKENKSQWQKLLSQLCSLLDTREQRIVSARFALGSERKASTLQALAKEMEISKERVRQLEKRALAKLRQAAGDLGLVDLVEPVV